MPLEVRNGRSSFTSDIIIEFCHKVKRAIDIICSLRSSARFALVRKSLTNNINLTVCVRLLRNRSLNNITQTRRIKLNVSPLGMSGGGSESFLFLLLQHSDPLCHSLCALQSRSLDIPHRIRSSCGHV